LSRAESRCDLAPGNCRLRQVLRYRARISGPLLDRLDLHVHVPRVELKSLRGQDGGGEASAKVAARVMRTRELQVQRQGSCNAHLDNAAVDRYCTPDMAGLDVLEERRQLGHLLHPYARSSAPALLTRSYVALMIASSLRLRGSSTANNELPLPVSAMPLA
jgi:predicted ATPase with chaperone activity